MDEQHSPTLQGWNQGPRPGAYPGPGQGGAYPGLGGGFGGPSGFGGGFGGPSGFEDPFAGPSGFGGAFAGPPALVNPTVIPPGGAGGAAAGLPGKLGEVKAFIDRMGGIDGVISGVSKFQKFVAIMQKFGPIIKLFMSKGKGKVAAVRSSKPVRRRKSRPRVRAKVRTKSHRSGLGRRR